MIVALIFYGYVSAGELYSSEDPIRCGFVINVLDSKTFSNNQTKSFELLSCFIDSSKIYGLFLLPSFRMRWDNFNVIIEPCFKFFDYPCWPRIKWENLLSAAYYNAFWRVRFSSKIDMIAGRFKINLYEGGILSGDDPPLDGILWRIANNRFYFYYFASQLDSKITQDSTNWYKRNMIYKRFLFGHGFEFRFKKHTFSFSEISLSFSVDNKLDWVYFNPLMLFYVRGWDTWEYGERNIFWILSANYWGAKYSTHLEFLVDDFYLPDPDQWAPHKLAWIFKFYSLDLPFRNSISGFCYSGATRWTYTHGLSLLYYENRNEVMGALNENDFDKIEIFSRKHLGDKFDLRGALWFKRKGEGSVNEKDIYWESGIDYPREYFLTGVVEKRFGQGLEVEWRDKRFLIRVSAEHDLIWNKGHEPEKKGSEWRIKVLGSFRVL